MRILLLVIWLLVPIGAIAFHYGPGQNLVKHDDAARQMRLVDYQRTAGDLDAAQKSLEKSLELLPDDDLATRRKLQLELCKVRLDNHGLPQARQELESLLEEMQADPKADTAMVNDCRETLANSQYYVTWLMRLEGMDYEAWGPEIESAQQNLRLLAQTAADEGDEILLTRHREDLESAVRLARMDLGELQGLPLPSQ